MDTIEFDVEFLSQKLSENPSSVLFARLADLYLTQNQTDEALRLCSEGIKLFPDYYAGHLVQGKIHLALKEYSKARASLERARELSLFNQKIAALLKEIPETPDAPERVTDDQYFAEKSAPAVEDAPAAEEPTVAAQTEEQPNQSLFDTMTPEEMMYAQQSGETTGSAAPTVQPAGEGFPPFEEYYAQNQSKVEKSPEETLDDFLRTQQQETLTIQEEAPAEVASVESPAAPASPAEIPAAPASPASPDDILAEIERLQGSPVAEGSAASPVSSEPEQVFSSPEQAELYAEMNREESSTAGSDLDALTEKLQNAERIVPKEPAAPEPEPSPASSGYSTDMITPTLAEIYASQGEFRAAIQAYEILMFSQPEKGGEYQKRIQELQQKQMEKDGLV